MTQVERALGVVDDHRVTRSRLRDEAMKKVYMLIAYIRQGISSRKRKFHCRRHGCVHICNTTAVTFL